MRWGGAPEAWSCLDGSGTGGGSSSSGSGGASGSGSGNGGGRTTLTAEGRILAAECQALHAAEIGPRGSAPVSDRIARREKPKDAALRCFCSFDSDHATGVGLFGVKLPRNARRV